jgi:hypothetical protein
MASVEQGPSYSQVPQPMYSVRTDTGDFASRATASPKPTYSVRTGTKDYASRATATDASKVVSGLAVYWLGALQDGTTDVSWISYVIDTSGAPQGHTYTHLRILATWVL